MARKMSEQYRELLEVRKKYAEKFNENAPPVGMGLNISDAEYIELLKKCIAEGKKLKVVMPDSIKYAVL